MKEQGSREKRIFRIVAGCILVFLLIAAVNVWRAKTRKTGSTNSEAAVPVQVFSVKTGDLDRSLEVTGDLLSLEDVFIYPKIPGKIIEKFFVEKGDYVEKGQIVASLEKAQIIAKRNRALAQVEVAKANLDVLKKDFDRIKSLYDKKAISRQKLDHISAQLSAAKAQLKEADAALKEIDVFYRDHDIRATISGIVADRYVDAGSTSSTDHPILRISNEATLKLEAAVPERDFPYVHKGMDVRFTVDACPGQVFSGRVAVVYPTIDPRTRTAKLEIHVSNPDLRLRSGMFANVKLSFGKHQALIVPIDCLNRMPGTGSYYVYVVEDGKACLKNIETGARQRGLVEVTSGLAEGDRVVIKGQMRLKDGTPVRVIEASPLETDKR